jgi:autotransporter translocation and assembly factor TamB
VTLDIPNLYTGALNANLKLEGPAARPTLSGRATLQDGTLSPTGTIGRAGGPGGVVLGVLPPALRLDMSLEAGPNTTFTLGAIRAKVEGAVHVGGTLAQPLMSGRVTSPEGEVAFLGSTFRLTGGEAVFAESLGVEPQISARAQQVYGDTIVFLDVNGPATHPELTLTANPPLPQEEIVTLVARNAGILGDPEAVLGQGLGRYLLGSVREALHLNEFTISYGRESPVTLRIGKFLVQNVYLTLSEVWPGPLGPTPAPFGTFPRALPTTQSYAVGGIEYFLSQNMLTTFNVDTLGGAGVFVLMRFPY